MDAVTRGLIGGPSAEQDPHAKEALREAYQVLALLTRHCGAKAAELVHATEALEGDPTSDGRRLLLEEKVKTARRHVDEDVQNAARALINASVSVGTNHGEVTGVKVGTVTASVNQSAVGSNIALATHGGNATVDSDRK